MFDNGPGILILGGQVLMGNFSFYKKEFDDNLFIIISLIDNSVRQETFVK